MHCSSVSVSWHPCFVLRICFQSLTRRASPAPHLPFHPGLAAPPSALAPLHLVLIGCHSLRERTPTSCGRCYEAPHFKGGLDLSIVLVWICAVLGIEPRPCTCQARALSLGYVPRLPESVAIHLGECSGLSLLHAIFFTDKSPGG